jgi:3-deoxy-D-manno-octulosonic-acid transferase
MNGTLPRAAQPTQVSAAAGLKLLLLAAAESLSDLRGNVTAGRLQFRVPAQSRRAVWVFASTIGELNAVGPLLKHVTDALPALQLVLITDHAHYADSYRTLWPAAEVCVSLGHRRDAVELGRHYPPALLLVAEIPCLPSDAPCRFSVSFLTQAKRIGAAAVLINGWLYGQQPASRMDGIERSLLARDYVRMFDAICVQMPETRAALLLAGADPSRVHVVGNLKFDAMQRPLWRPEQARSAGLLTALQASGRPVIVAGCVTDLTEQHLVLRAFDLVRKADPRALLVLAPRHPEKRDRLDALRALLQEYGMTTAFRSVLGEAREVPDAACVVLDTMGDLRDFYAAATVAHVGVNHNLLEPLSFGKPVTLIPGWTSSYPSFPVYRLLRQAGAVREVADADALAKAWLATLAGTASRHDQSGSMLENALGAVYGAVQRHVAVLRPWIERSAAMADPDAAGRGEGLAATPFDRLI